MRTKTFLTLALLSIALCGCATGKTKPTIKGVPNLALVDAGQHIYRGGQPKTAEGWKTLHDVLQVTNVIKLNTKLSASDAGAIAAGMTVTYIPINTWEQTFGPVNKKLWKAYHAIAPGTFIHCTHGVNRTGTEIILYRVKHDHWTKEKAIAEADKLDWETSLPALKKFVKDLK